MPGSISTRQRWKTAWWLRLVVASGRAERVSSGRSVRFVSGVSWVIKRKLSGKKEERQPYETVVYVLVC